MNSEQMLTSLLHTVQMGQSGIESVRRSAIRPGLQKELKSQLTEYDAIEAAARQLAKDNGWKLQDLNPALLKMSDLMSKARLMGGERDSKIAGMLIQGNTRGMILGLKNLRKSQKAAPEVVALANRLIAHERGSIESSQNYL